MSDFIFKQLINGEWVDASDGGVWPLLNPATEELLLDIPFGKASDATAAIEINPDELAAFRNRGNIYVTKGYVKAAIADFQKLGSAPLPTTRQQILISHWHAKGKLNQSKVKIIGFRRSAILQD